MDVGFHEFRRQLDYKAQMRGNHVEVADRDLNAAIKLFRTVSSTEIEACGEERSGFGVSRSETILGEAGIWT